MFLNSQTFNNPIFLVSPAGDYIRDDAGNPVTFEGEAVAHPETGHLIDTQGNFLFCNNSYIPLSSLSTPHNTTAAAPQTQQNNEKKSSIQLLIPFSVILVLSLITIGGALAYHFLTSDENADNPPNTSPSPRITQTETSHSEPIENMTTDSTPRNTLPPEAYPGAGSPNIPARSTYVGNHFAILMPSGNIGCHFNAPDNMFCTALNWEAEELYGPSPNMSDGVYKPYNGVKITLTGEAELIAGEINGASYTPPYGTTFYDGDYICASEENGITCWSKQSGHGFFMNRDGYKSF